MAKKNTGKNMTQFAVIGLGRFGTAVTKQLYDDGMDVMAVDLDSETVNRAAEYATQTVCANAADEHVLKSLGISNFDAVIVCIGGSNIEASVFVTLLAKQMGVKHVIARASSAMHKSVLEKIGADFVIFPEEYMGIKVASMLTNPNMLEVLELTDDYRIVEIKTPSSWQNKTLMQLDIRNKFGVNILVIKRGEKIISNVSGETPLLPGDEVVICGSIANTDKVKSLATEKITDLEDLT